MRIHCGGHRRKAWGHSSGVAAPACLEALAEGGIRPGGAAPTRFDPGRGALVRCGGPFAVKDLPSKTACEQPRLAL